MVARRARSWRGLLGVRLGVRRCSLLEVCLRSWVGRSPRRPRGVLSPRAIPVCLSVVLLRRDLGRMFCTHLQSIGLASRQSCLAGICNVPVRWTSYCRVQRLATPQSLCISCTLEHSTIVTLKSQYSRPSLQIIVESQRIDSQFFNPALLIVRMTLKSPTLSANSSISTAALLLSGH
jgi:hypothetical protein